MFIEVGVDGSKLSGGQKQRLAIARALYADADIYLLDDVFSSVDVHVIDGLYNDAIKRLLVRRGKTVLMTISQYKYLKYADRLLYVENGKLYTDKNEIEKRFPLDELIVEQEVEFKKSKHSLFTSKILGIGEETREVMDKFLNQDAKEQEEERESGELDNRTFYAYIGAMGSIAFVFFLIFN